MSGKPLHCMVTVLLFRQKEIYCRKLFPMDRKRYSLEAKESNRFVKFAQIIFGAVCIITSAWWVVFILKSGEGNNYWVATLFMLFFGLFQILSGLGHASRYVEFSNEEVIIKQNSIGLPDRMPVKEISSIEMLPLSVKFSLKSGRKRTLRFGVTYTDLIDTIKDELEIFAREKNISIEEKSETI
jgi:hypothetical protein